MLPAASTALAWQPEPDHFPKRAFCSAGSYTFFARAASEDPGRSMTGVPTGFADLDELTNGLHAGQLILVAARPALGKSTLALDFARGAAIKHDLPTIIFSLEMGRSEIAMRLLSAEARQGATAVQ